MNGKNLKIAIDVRPLLDKQLTGVGEYTLNLLKNLFKIDKTNQYFIFYNSFNLDIPKIFYNNQNVHICKFQYPNKIFNLLTLKNFIKLDKLINQKFKTNIDIFFFPNLSFINTSNNCKTIITIHDLSFVINPEYFSFKHKLWHKLIKPKNTIINANHIITVSNNTKNDLIELFNIDKNKISPIHLGIEIEKIDHNYLNKFKQKYNLPEKFLLYLGTIEPRKNILTILHAFENLKTDHHLILAGKLGWKYKKILRAIKYSRKKNKILYIGYIPKQDKKYLYYLAEIFIYPSFYEGFGIPPLEASAYKCPVITSVNSCLGEILKQGAVYINPYNTGQLLNAIKLIIHNPKIKTHLQQQAKKNIQNYNWEITAQKTLKIFEKL